MVHQGGPPLFLGFLGGTIFGIRIHLSYRNQVLGYQSWQRSWCHLRLEWKDAEVARWTTKWDANCHQQWTICDLDGSTWMASQHSQPTPPPRKISGYFWGGDTFGGGVGWLAIISEDRWCFLFRSLKHERMMKNHIFVDHWNWAILKMACQQLQTVFLVAELCCWIFWIICFRHESLRIVRVVSQVSFHFWAPFSHPGPIIRNCVQNKQTSTLLCRSGLCGRVRRRKSKVKSLQFVSSP